MSFGGKLRKLRTDRGMTLRQLGEKAGMDYVVLNKIELGLRVPPPLEGIIALADALHEAKPLRGEELEELIEQAAEPTERAGARFTPDVVERLKESKTAGLFFTRRSTGRKERR